MINMCGSLKRFCDAVPPVPCMMAVLNYSGLKISLSMLTEE